MRRLAVIACFLAPLAAAPSMAQSARSLDRAHDLRCREAGFRPGTPAHQRCRAGLERMRAGAPAQRGDRRLAPYGSSSPPPLDIIRPRPFSPPPVVGMPAPVVVAPSLPSLPAIIDAAPPPGVHPGISPLPVVPPPLIILGPAGPRQSPGLLPVPTWRQ